MSSSRGGVIDAMFEIVPLEEGREILKKKISEGVP